MSSAFLFRSERFKRVPFLVLSFFFENAFQFELFGNLNNILIEANPKSPEMFFFTRFDPVCGILFAQIEWIRHPASGIKLRHQTHFFCCLMFLSRRQGRRDKNKPPKSWLSNGLSKDYPVGTVPWVFLFWQWQIWFVSQKKSFWVDFDLGVTLPFWSQLDKITHFRRKLLHIVVFCTNGCCCDPEPRNWDMTKKKILDLVDIGSRRRHPPLPPCWLESTILNLTRSLKIKPDDVNMKM